MERTLEVHAAWLFQSINGRLVEITDMSNWSSDKRRVHVAHLRDAGWKLQVQEAPVHV